MSIRALSRAETCHDAAMGKDKKAKKKDKKKSREDKVKLAAAKGVVEEVAAKNAASEVLCQGRSQGRGGRSRRGRQGRHDQGRQGREERLPITGRFRRALRVGPDFVLADLDPESHPGFDGDRAAGEAMMAGLAEQVA
jgi:hypothetical protein